MLTSISKKEQHISAFYEFLKVTHPKAQSDLKYIPRDVLEIILTEYVFKSFDPLEMIECGLNTFFFKKMCIQPNLCSQNNIQKCVTACCEHGNVEVLTWLFSETKKRNVKITARHLIDVAAKHGHLDVIKFLHFTHQENVSAEEVCTFYAMNWAARNGHIDVVEWLHVNRKEGCTIDAMDWAAERGHLHVVEWLHENRTEGCSSGAMSMAAIFGHLDVVKWLHNNRKEGCSRYAMNWAAEYGHLHVVEWLHINRSEGCTTDAMDLAAEYGHLDILQFLHENRTEGCTEKAKSSAERNNRHHVLDWLRVHYPQFFDKEN